MNYNEHHLINTILINTIFSKIKNIIGLNGDSDLSNFYYSTSIITLEKNKFKYF